MNLADQIENRDHEALALAESSSSDAKREVVAIALRDVLGKLEDYDRGSLEAALIAAEWTLADYRLYLELIPQLRNKQAELEEKQSQADQVPRLRAELIREEQKAKAAIKEAKRRLQMSEYARQGLIELKLEIGKITARHPCLLELNMGEVRDTRKKATAKVLPRCKVCNGHYDPTNWAKDDGICSRVCREAAPVLND